MMRSLLLVAVAFATAGCASLEVDVAILERSVVDDLVAEDRLASALPVIRAESREDVTRQVTEIRHAHHAVYANTANAIMDEVAGLCIAPGCTAEFVRSLHGIQQQGDILAAESLVNEHCEAVSCDSDTLQTVVDLSTIAAALETRFAPTWMSKYSEWQRDWHGVNEALRSLASEWDAAPDEISREQVRNRFLLRLEQREAVIRNFRRRIAADLDIEDGEDGASASIRDAQAILASNKLLTAFEQSIGNLVATQALTELFSSGGLEHSKYASVVAGADPELWTTAFDHAEGRGTFGNVDVAIKALGPTNFTIKGLSFNPADIAIAASKVTTQALLIAAQISGVPVNIKGTPTGNGASLAQSSAGLQTVRNDLIEAQTSIKTFHDALDVLAGTIINETDAIESADVERLKESLAVIDAVYESQKSRLGGVSDGGGSP